jgi:Cobalamin synthesis protein cobW C-terminal domain
MIDSSASPEEFPRTDAVIAVAGPAGAGKTTWISQHLAPAALYCALGSDTVPIDATYLAAQYPDVQILTEPEAIAALLAPSRPAPLYLEIGFHLELASLEQRLGACQRVAVLSTAQDSVEVSDWRDWADTVVAGAASAAQTAELWRSPLTGQLFDPASLQMLWRELTGGAYGQVQRAKGIFDLADGRAFGFNFVAGLPQAEITELTLPRWVLSASQGRPQRFSGLEVVGHTLDRASLIQTIRDCCLADAAIAPLQQTPSLTSGANP